MPVNHATPIVPSTMVKLSKTGCLTSIIAVVPKVSIYRCLLKKPESDVDCTYYAAQMDTMCTHIHRKHLKLYIKCRLCKKKSYSSTQMSLYLKTIHSNQEGEWFEPTPLLEGDLEEIKTEVLAANLQEVEDVIDEPDEDE